MYQDHLTKYVLLKPLTHKRTEEVVYTLLDIFTTFGASCILQSDNGREFIDKVIEKLCNMWDNLKIVHGKPLHLQSQGSVERANQDRKYACHKWRKGLKCIQFMKNRSLHHALKCSPYEAMFGTQVKIGLKSTSYRIIDKLKSDKNLETALNSISVQTTIENEEISVENIDIHEEPVDVIRSRQEIIVRKRNESLHNLKLQALKMKKIQ